MRTRQKNPVLKGTMDALLQKGAEGALLWKAIARGLNRPRRVRYETDLKRLERFAKPRETIAVPGVVLSQGELRKPLTVAAVRFTPRAREKIEKAGGRCISMQELMEKSPSRVRIMG
jgi:large subunit ribosomal protein L18e